MLDSNALNHWFEKLQVSQPARSLIEMIRTTSPSRNVYGGRSNVCGRYPSKKMGHTVQFESHRNELAFIYEYEHDEDVLEYYDQPSPIQLIYKTKQGRRIKVMHTPDFFVIRKNSVGWEECKTEEDLIKLSKTAPNRYGKGDSKWHCIPGEEFAAEYKFFYCLRSSNEINWAKLRNLQFLEDYFLENSTEVPISFQNIAISTLISRPGIYLNELFEIIEKDVSKEDIFRLIATGKIYVDLNNIPLVESDKVRVFQNKEIAERYTSNQQNKLQNASNPDFINLQVGNSISWDSVIWKIVNVGQHLITLLRLNNSYCEIPINVFENLIKTGKITAILCQTAIEPDTYLTSLVAKASEADHKIATERFNYVSRILNGEKYKSITEVSERTLRRWVRHYKDAEKKYNNGYIGLLTKNKVKGNRKNKLPVDTIKLMDEFIENDYETLKRKRKYEVWVLFRHACKQKEIVCPSYKTFVAAIHNRNQYQQTLKRQGSRAAYDKKPFIWMLSHNVPKHGDRPFEICHIDHTELDIELICSTNNTNLGRPWATMLIDAYSRRILAIVLSFDSPSYRSCMNILRECVRLHSRLPQTIVVDGGKEFKSVYFESMLACFECTKKVRPPAQARFGSVCERLFGTTNSQFIHNLRGNTQITKQVRQVTKSIDPKMSAVWTLERLYEKLQEYAYTVYDNLPHPALGQSPREAFNQGMVFSGNRKYRYIPYDQKFLIWTLPTTVKGTAKVIPGKGIIVNKIMYWSDSFRNPQIEKTNVGVRYDPFNVGVAYAFVGGQWIQCFSEYYTLLQGRSEKELRIVTSEIIMRSKVHTCKSDVSIKVIADFLQSVEGEEKLLLQAMKDRESKRVQESSKNVDPKVNAVKSPAEIKSTEESFQITDETLDLYGEFK